MRLWAATDQVQSRSGWLKASRGFRILYESLGRGSVQLSRRGQTHGKQDTDPEPARVSSSGKSISHPLCPLLLREHQQPAGVSCTEEGIWRVQGAPWLHPHTPTMHAEPTGPNPGRGVAWKEGVRHRADHFCSYWGGKAISLGFGQPDLGLSCASNQLCDLGSSPSLSEPFLCLETGGIRLDSLVPFTCL